MLELGQFRENYRPVWMEMMAGLFLCENPIIDMILVVATFNFSMSPCFYLVDRNRSRIKILKTIKGGTIPARL